MERSVLTSQPTRPQSAGVPIGQPEFVTDFLGGKEQRTFHPVWAYAMGQGHLFSLIAPPHVRINEGELLVEDCQTRVDRGLRRTPWRLCVEMPEQYSGNTPTALWSTSDRTLALSAGGLGFTSAHRVRRAAHFASWADALTMVRKRHPNIKSMIMHLEVGGVPGLRAARECRELVEKVGVGNALLGRIVSVPLWATKVGPVWWCSRFLSPFARLPVELASVNGALRWVCPCQSCRRRRSALDSVTLSGTTIARAEVFPFC